VHAGREIERQGSDGGLCAGPRSGKADLGRRPGHGGQRPAAEAVGYLPGGTAFAGA
jgi:hypothetical protein